MDRAQLETRIRAILTHYRVNQKWIKGQTSRGYAVYAGPNTGRMRPNPDIRQISEVLSSREANDLKKDLIVADLIKLFEESNHVHEE